MEKITIKKEKLKEIIVKNRAEHRDIFLKAQGRYREEVIKQLDSMLADARDGKRIRVAINLVEPQDHTDDYDRAIKMLELAEEESMVLSEVDIACYVMDQWGWSRNWAVSNMRYVPESAKLQQLSNG